MKFSKTLMMGTIAACFSISSVFALPNTSGPAESSIIQQQNEKVEKKTEYSERQFKCKKGCFKHGDPLKSLENKKLRIQTMVKEGKVTKEEADEKLKKIDERIKHIQEFNNLPLQQKKDKLLSALKVKMDSKVKEGKLTQEKADEIIKRCTEKIQNWDGKGFPSFDKKGLKN